METCNAASYKYNGNEKLKLRNFNYATTEIE